MGYIRFLVNVSVVMGATGGAVGGGGGGGGGGEDVSNGIVPVSGTAYSYAESGKNQNVNKTMTTRPCKSVTFLAFIENKLATLCIVCKYVSLSLTFGKSFNTSRSSYQVLESVISKVRGFFFVAHYEQ